MFGFVSLFNYINYLKNTAELTPIFSNYIQDDIENQILKESVVFGNGFIFFNNIIFQICATKRYETKISDIKVFYPS